MEIEVGVGYIKEVWMEVFSSIQRQYMLLLSIMVGGEVDY